MSNLYELTSDLAQLKEIDEMDDAKLIIEIIETELRQKGTGLIKLNRIIDANVNQCSDEIKELTDKRRVWEKRKKKIREYILSCMENADIKKIETAIGNMTVRKGVSTLKIEDEDKLPDKYLEVIHTYKVDKDLLKKDIKDGLVVEGAYMTKPKNTLMIK
ncbi:siphovirus Gp157 family protein [Clostridioides mangenotii]|uniref:siphovirus Gp157 family protein n=1 Tax=Metaclostridioides mangenotii TaxID=1540 RepID=UPI00214A7034|nr:siphovirus Gp157 family protein [Clostridioides mangenotii]MCR1955498.1 siphovirus Gp157 family protein [Clostridioides mangenotii]